MTREEQARYIADLALARAEDTGAADQVEFYEAMAGVMAIHLPAYSKAASATAEAIRKARAAQLEFHTLITTPNTRQQ